MMELEPGVQVYLAPGATDMRKSIDGLAALVSAGFELNPFSNAWFVFCGKRKDRLKILRWDCNGFWLYYRRLEKGRFQWPSQTDKIFSISRRQLSWLLDGLSVEQAHCHRAVKASITA
jgi:transposase